MVRLVEIINEIETDVKETMFPSDFKRHNLGTCMSAAALASDYLLKRGIKNFKIVEGFVSMYPDQEQEDWSPHTWIEFDNGRKFDPTKKQWKQWGFDPNETKYEKITKTYTPEQYIKLCRLDGSLTENNEPEAKIQQIKSILPYLTDETVVVSVQRCDELPASNYVQVDEFSNGDNYFSSNPETMNRLGYKMPSTQELLKLPQGRYTMKRIKEIFAKYTKESVNENMSYDELLRLTADTPRSPDDNTNRIDRSKNVRTRSMPVTMEEDQEQWNFRYKSSPQTSITHKPFEGAITFLKGEVGRNDSAEDLECKVDCGCPDYRYKFAWNNAAQDAGDIGPDTLNQAINRKPKPAYDIGEGLCKHLSALSKFLQTKIKQTQRSNLFEAINEVAKQGPFNITYYD